MILGRKKPYKDRERECWEQYSREMNRWKWGFAFFPVRLHDGRWIWLERYRWRKSIQGPNGTRYQHPVMQRITLEQEKTEE